METVNPTIDPVTLEVVKHKLWAVPEEQAITLKSVSGSPIVTEATISIPACIWLMDPSSR